MNSDCLSTLKGQLFAGIGLWQLLWLASQPPAEVKHSKFDPQSPRGSKMGMQTAACSLAPQGASSHSAGTAWAQRGHSTNYYVVYPGNTPANHPPTEACMIHSKQHRGCRIQDPGTRGYRW